MTNQLKHFSANYHGNQWSIWATFENYSTRPFDKAYLNKDGTFDFFLNHHDEYDVIHGYEEQKLEAEFGDMFRAEINKARAA